MDFMLTCLSALSPQIYKLEDMDPVFWLLYSAQQNVVHCNGSHGEDDGLAL